MEEEWVIFDSVLSCSNPFIFLWLLSFFFPFAEARAESVLLEATSKRTN